MTILAVLQPSFLPWLGCFEQLDRADVFVLYDDVQFDLHGWRNRNRIKTSQGISWVSVPVLHKGRMGQPILSVEIDNRQPWARKLTATLHQAYAKASYRDAYLPELAEVLQRDWRLLVDLDIAVLDLMQKWLGIGTRTVRSSTLGIVGERSERLLRLCQHFGVDRYLSGSAAQAYLDVPLFERSGVSVEWQDYAHPQYPQLHGDFVSHLSALDLILNVGPGSLAVIREGRGGPREAAPNQAQGVAHE